MAPLYVTRRPPRRHRGGGYRSYEYEDYEPEHPKPARRGVPRLAGRTGFDYRFDVASHVMAAGTQDVIVQPIVPLSPHVTSRAPLPRTVRH